ncbi:MAG TPA: hypothetical protein VF412_10025 [Bdellovibrio sp.]|uniref:hypothetical protein n=1 Tax=Bdellovibrio sp. TaxID=28201 RepID=UPI002F17C16A
MKKLIAFAVVSLAVSSSFADHLVCNAGKFSSLTIDVQANASSAVVKVLQSPAQPGDVVYPKVGEKAVLTAVREGVDPKWLVLNNEETASLEQRGFGLNILRSDLSKSSFRAVFSAAEADESTVYHTFEMTCVRQ